MISTVVGQLLLGWLAADFLSGLFHWWEDRIGSPTFPLLGDWIIAPNRLHHERPLAFIQEGTFMTRNKEMIVASLLVGSGLSYIFGFSPLIASLMVGGAFVNEVHAYAHSPRMAPRWALVLQETGFFQSPKHHAEHHRPPQDKVYCILTNWLNPILEAVRFFPALEKVFRREKNGRAN